MAKKSVIARDKKRRRLADKYDAARKEYKKKLNDPDIADEEFYEVQRKLAKLPRNSSRVRIRNRCSITGRGRAFSRRFGVSRITFRELASEGKIPGIVKSSW